VNPERAASFYAQVRRYWPALPDNSLLPDYSGVRPKVAYNGTIHSDFDISTAQQHGIKGLVNLFGIESPGLTASLALAKRVTQLLGRA
jgi:L-2-hydroxyglutarate oxidase LhgO